MGTTGAADWVVVLPVKGGAEAKSRLACGPEVAAAMAADCLAAVLAANSVLRVLVVTSDAATASAASAAGAEVVEQPTSKPGLGPAVRAGLLAAGDRGPVAVLLADLPAVRPEDLDRALSRLDDVLARGAVSAFVPDLDDAGTVLLAGRTAAHIDPHFGAGSAAAHERTGAVRASLDLPRLRRDVDTQADLAAAIALGVGPRTTATLDAMQATVIRYDPDAGTGEVVTDDGIRLPMANGATNGSGLRHLRPGQRVSCDPVHAGDEVGGEAGTADTRGETGAADASPVAVTRVRLQGIGD